MQSNTAFLIIDVQMIMFTKEYPVYMSDVVLARISDLLRKARLSNAPVFYIQHTQNEDMPMAMGKPLWQLHPDLMPCEGETKIMKYTPDCFLETGLDEKLRSLGIKNLVITGMQTEICVDTTCRRAFSLGYNVTLVSDAHSTFDTDLLSADKIIKHHNNIISSWFGRLSKTEEVIF